MKDHPYRDHLGKEKKFLKMLENEIFIPQKTTNITLSLVWSIMSQQLSIKVAKVLFQRFLDLYPGKKPTAAMIVATPVEKIRSIGASQSKANYIHNVAKFIVENKVNASKLAKMTDQEIIEFLTQIKGVGRWTVEMLLIFGLGREDVFALDDLGIQKEMIRLFKLENLSKKELRVKMEQLSQKWSPYRTYVCLHLWNFQGFKP